MRAYLVAVTVCHESDFNMKVQAFDMIREMKETGIGHSRAAAMLSLGSHPAPAHA